jgi:hypothetical protein
MEEFCEYGDEVHKSRYLVHKHPNQSITSVFQERYFITESVSSLVG